MTGRNSRSASLLEWTCADVRAYVAAGAGPLPGLDCALYEAHLETCEACRALVDAYYRERAPAWVRPWLEGRSDISEVVRAREAAAKPLGEPSPDRGAPHRGSGSPFADEQADAQIEEVEMQGLAARSVMAKPWEDGRRYLRRGRHDFVLKGGGRTAAVQVEERESGVLWIRWMNGARITLRDDSAPLSDRFRALPDRGEHDLLQLLKAHVRWSD